MGIEALITFGEANHVDRVLRAQVEVAGHVPNGNEPEVRQPAIVELLNTTTEEGSERPTRRQAVVELEAREPVAARGDGGLAREVELLTQVLVVQLQVEPEARSRPPEQIHVMLDEERLDAAVRVAQGDRPEQLEGIDPTEGPLAFRIIEISQ